MKIANFQQKFLVIILRIPFFKSGQKLKWKKLNLKKSHFTNEEEIFVAKMISDGADYNKVLQWHLQLFGRPMHKSKFYAHRKRPQKLWPSLMRKNPPTNTQDRVNLKNNYWKAI